MAQHSGHVSRLVPIEDALAGLLHDAAEAFLGDVSAPLKSLLPDYRAIEARVKAFMLARLGLSLPLPRSVKRANLVMLAIKQRDLMHGDNWSTLALVEQRGNCSASRQAGCSGHEPDPGGSHERARLLCVSARRAQAAAHPAGSAHRRATAAPLARRVARVK